MWTVSGLYFSWTDINEIHGDQFRNKAHIPKSFDNLISPSAIPNQSTITTLELKEIPGDPYFWVNQSQLYNAKTGAAKKIITESKALQVARHPMLPELKVAHIQLINHVGKHSEYMR
tara:strand:+ start:31595 stop:31945 length:351 start_codon:yes stop_codon:yes gene_type:complete